MSSSKTKILLISASGKTGGGPSHIFLLTDLLKDEFDFYLAMPKVGNLSKKFDRRKYLEIAERKILPQDIIRLVLFSKKNSNSNGFINPFRQRGDNISFFNTIIYIIFIVFTQ